TLQKTNRSNSNGPLKPITRPASAAVFLPRPPLAPPPSSPAPRSRRRLPPQAPARAAAFLPRPPLAPRRLLPPAPARAAAFLLCPPSRRRLPALATYRAAALPCPPARATARPLLQSGDQDASVQIHVRGATRMNCFLVQL
uniref:Uncharacterized protein n=1 Tax=Aegilops tauschii subsp. strangulata TaxID=200361 RepID=A0A453B089_AEGTS